MNCVQGYCPYADATFRFFCRKRSWSTCAGVRLLRCAVTISPAVEKTLSAATLVPGIHKYRLASPAKRGKAVWWVLHQLSGFSDRERGGASRYFFSSSSALELADLRITLTSVNVLPNSVTSAEGLLFGAGPSSCCDVSDSISASSEFTCLYRNNSTIMSVIINYVQNSHTSPLFYG